MRLMLLSLFGLTTLLHAASAGFYQQPALRGDTVLFVAEGDIWRTTPGGGVAQRLTTHAGWENRPAIAPDGKQVAFSAIIDGKAELYTIPIDGGLPVRHTFDNSSPKRISWTPDGRILFATDKHSTLPDTQLVELNPITHERKVVPLAQASDGCYGDDGTLYFVRLPKQSSATKRYRGGWIENLWKFKAGDAEATRLEPQDKSTSRSPMWWLGRIYFVSDRDGTMNLWSMKPDGSDAKQHTKHVDMDVKSPALDEGRIVYQLGADLRLLDLASGKDAPINISLISDFDQQREQWVKKPFEYLTTWGASPNGDRVVLTARGEVFVAPFEPGRLVELLRNEGVRYRNATFLPDGKTLLLQSDASGEIEFWTAPANGTEAPKQITSDGKRFRFGGKPSPDGKWFAWGDKDMKLWVYGFDKKETKLITTAPGDTIRSDFAWSPDSQWIAFSQEAANTYKQIKICRVTDLKIETITTDRTNSYSPAWSPDGKWLYFLSDRELRTVVESPWGLWQPEPFYTDTVKIYHLALKKGERSPFRPADELSATSTPSTSPTKSATATSTSSLSSSTVNRLESLIRPMVERMLEEKGTEKPRNDGQTKTGTSKTPAKPEVKKPSAPSVIIDLDGLATRLEEVPVPAGNYEDLTVGSKYLYFTSKPAGFNTKKALKHYEITGKPHSTATMAEDINGYELCLKDNKMVVKKGDAFYTIDANASAPVNLSNSAETAGWAFTIDPREEWKQIYVESWRMMRDYFYDRGMHGLDWNAIRKKYEPLVDRVTERNELTSIISDMLGELTALHIYVRFGDDRDVPDVIETAGLGAPLERDEKAGGWRVTDLWQSDPEFPNKKSPLTKPGIDVVKGDIITKINGRSTLSVPHPDALLRNQVGKQVLLEIKSGDKTRQAIFKPINAEADFNLRYEHWEYTRRLKTEELGKGQIGYVHLRAMGEDDIAQWARDFYPVFQRQGLIIDVRHNRGGNIDSWILEKLLRKAWSYFAPVTGQPHWNMQYAFRGHLVVLCDHFTASDGEGFSEGFRRLGLGKVIGTRTWGGQIWLSAQRWLVDSGMATAAEMGVYSPEGQWLIEGEGVHPDIEVDNLPHQTFLGKDAQLEAGVKHLQDLIAKDPRPPVPVPPHPKKRFSDDDKK